MRALVVDGPEEIGVHERPDPRPTSGEVLVRSRVMGLCHTDVDILHGRLEAGWVDYPCIPGHEWSGVVVSAGDGGGGLRPGQTVVAEGHLPCLGCARCLAGETNLCLNYRQLGFTVPGGGAELLLVPRRFVHPNSPAVDPEEAVLIEPAASVVRMLRRLALQPGEHLGVIGVGTLGAAAILLGRLAGARVTAVGIRASELALAEQLGAERTVDASAGGVDGRPFDTVIETAGAVPAVTTALHSVRRGGRAGLLGLAGAGQELRVAADRFANDDITVVGGASYDRSAWARTVAVVNERRLDLRPLIGARFDLTDYASAYAAVERRTGSGRTLVHHAA
jgi:threonine dehydrogenase-like Zn-dependent dehydrogenase